MAVTLRRRFRARFVFSSTYLSALPRRFLYSYTTTFTDRLLL